MAEGPTEPVLVAASDVESLLAPGDGRRAPGRPLPGVLLSVARHPGLRWARRCAALAGLAAALCAVVVVTAHRVAHHRSQSHKGAPIQVKTSEGHGCCSEESADCLACEANLSIGDFCAHWVHATLPGCLGRRPPGCCAAETAECLSCGARKSMEEYCAERTNFLLRGCSGYCGATEDDMYYGGGDLSKHTGVEDAQECCSKCRAEPRCSAWSWGKKGPFEGVCTLMHQIRFRREANTSFKSGVPGHDTATFQIKSRHGICLEYMAPWLHLWECQGESKRGQQWIYNRSTGQIRTKSGDCLETSSSAKYKVRTQRCRRGGSPGQAWDHHGGVTGHIRSRGSGYCITAVHATRKGSFLQMLPCDPEDADQQWTMWNTADLNTDATIEDMLHEAERRTTSTLNRDVTLFCISLIVPWSYESKLLKMQLEEHRSIFACDSFIVYSNPALKLGAMETRVLPIDLHCEKGGIYNTLYNTPIFVKLWEQVIYDGHFRFHNWTVKADTDTVFFPERLRAMIRHYDSEAGDGIFLNNCHFGLHGPLEVVSRRALEVYSLNWWDCEQPPQEDVYLQACMKKLGVKQVDRFDLLAEDHCDSPDWEDCASNSAAFHPFKSAGAYKTCLYNAR